MRRCKQVAALVATPHAHGLLVVEMLARQAARLLAAHVAASAAAAAAAEPAAKVHAPKKRAGAAFKGAVKAVRASHALGAKVPEPEPEPEPDSAAAHIEAARRHLDAARRIADPPAAAAQEEGVAGAAAGFLRLLFGHGAPARA
jgi:hypothetical protein